MEVVPVKSAWASKINITAIVSALLALAVGVGLEIPEPVKVQILTITGVVGPIIVGILRTWFTASVTPTVAAKL